MCVNGRFECFLPSQIVLNLYPSLLIIELGTGLTPPPLLMIDSKHSIEFLCFLADTSPRLRHFPKKVLSRFFAKSPHQKCRNLKKIGKFKRKIGRQVHPWTKTWPGRYNFSAALLIRIQPNLKPKPKYQDQSQKIALICAVSRQTSRHQQNQEYLRHYSSEFKFET